MESTCLTPGFRFYPTDVELIMYYLKRKVLGKKLSVQAILELNIYKFSPWDLPEKSCLKSKDREWYFFCPREKKYASGGRTNRAAELGYWKTTGKDRSIPYKDRVVGLVKTLIFHQGHPPKGERTDWVIHEYRMNDQHLADAGVAQDMYVLCKLFHKDGPGARKGSQYGATFEEEEWDDETADCGETIPIGSLAVATASGTRLLPTPNTSELTNMDGPEVSYISPFNEQDPPSLLGDGVGIPLMEHVDFQSMWDSFTEEGTPPGQSDGHEIFDYSNLLNPVSGADNAYSILPDIRNSPGFGGGLFSDTEMQSFPDCYLELNDLNNSDPDSYLELDDLNNTDPSLSCYGFPDFGSNHCCLGSTQFCMQTTGQNDIIDPLMCEPPNHTRT